VSFRSFACVWVCVLAGCAHHADEVDPAPAATADAPRAAQPAVRAQMSGRAFPEGVLALTWDDGPEPGTLALAEYLHREHVSGTFFVVGGWDPHLSSDPGYGARVYDSGFAKMPVLGELVALGHRVGNHTMHHVLLGRAPERAARELGDAQRAIDPFVRDELRLFRAPGGDWSAGASRAVDGDPYLAELVGPVRWDVDAKDWEGSLWCESSPAGECERRDGRYRVRADVIAERYEKAVEAAGRGVVLLHDRVGDVGSGYSLEVAERLVPWLEARGYVFSAPVLAFGPLRTRWTPGRCAGLRLADVDGDGRADACVRAAGRVVCATTTLREEDGLERATFDEGPRLAASLPPDATRFEVADVSGDGRADVCVRGRDGVECARALASGAFGPFEPWSRDLGGPLELADVDGDGRADACEPTPDGVACARSTGDAFEAPRTWLRTTPALAATMGLGDVDGDGRADVCVRGGRGVLCALSRRGSFGRLSRWADAMPGDGPLALGDLNGDGRADVCARGPHGVACALSSGRALTGAVRWLDSDPGGGSEWGRLGDLNGDGRSDFCTCDGDGVRCGVAP
jgi:peptidoglycan/xylan/chitin deacetylase (PgdA/CDA1 family)